MTTAATDTCYSCGRPLDDGAEERISEDPAVGYSETVYICATCLLLEKLKLVCYHTHRCTECGAIHDRHVTECDWDEDHDSGLCDECRAREADGPDILEIYKAEVE